MKREKTIFCPSCNEKIFPSWWNPAGVFRGWCPTCRSIVYVRDNGRPWLSRLEKQWLTIRDDPDIPARNNSLRLHFLITETELTIIRDYLRDVWEEFIRLFFPRKGKSK